MITCCDDIFEKWLDIIKKYVGGHLPNTRGDVIPLEEGNSKGNLKVGQIKQAPNTVQLNTTLFRCFLGLGPEEVRQIQAQILDGKVWVKCAKDVPYHVDMEEACRKLKGDKCLQEAIVDYYKNLSNLDVDWGQVQEMYGIGDAEYDHIYKASTQYIKLATHRAKATPSILPKAVTSYLSFLYRKSKGLEAREDIFPWIICVIGNEIGGMMKHVEVFSNQIPVGLVILEAQYSLQWKLQDFEILLSGIDNINVGTHYVMVSFISFAKIGTFIDAFQKRQGSFHYEVGVYK